MKKFYVLLCLFVSLALFGTDAISAPTFTIQNVKDACGGQANGSFDVVITAATPNAGNHLRVQVIGPPDSFFDLGVPGSYPVTVNVTGLTGAVGGFSYVIIVRDVANTVKIQDIFDYPAITIVSTSKTDNTTKDCVSPAPNGTLNANVTGGSPSGITYTWNGPGGPYVSAATPAVNGLAGGTYTLTATDNATACSATSAPVVILDPIPVIETITPTGNVAICPGSDFPITVQNSESDPAGVTYEVLVNGAPSSPLVSGLGTGADLTLTLLSGNFANNDVVTVRAHYSSCTTYQPMTGSATIQIQNLSSSAVITPNSRCIIPFDGAIDLSVSGGVGVLSYAWTGPNGFTAATEDIGAVEDGNYSVIITDGTTTCFITSNFVVGNARPTLSTSSVVTDNNKCVGFNGAIDLSVAGSIGPFSYSWTGPAGFTAFTEDIASVQDGNYNITIIDAPSGCSTSALIVVGNARPTIDATSIVTDNTRCVVAFNGAIDITPSGGTGPYTYIWTGTGVVVGNQDQIGLQGGAYSVTITETPSGCSVVKNFNINTVVPTIDATSVVTNNTRCVGPFNGAINITPSGGIGPYTFAWTGTGVVAGNEDQVGLDAGAYSVTITETPSGCSVVKNFNINTVVPTIDATVAITDNTRCVAAFNGAIDITPSGGTGVYTYAWTGTGVVAGNEDQSGLDAGSYSVTITETPSGCTVLKNYTVNSLLPTIVAPGAVTDNTGCLTFTGAIDINPAGGAGPYSFAWTGTGVIANAEDQVGLNAGAYSVTVTDGASGCQVVSNFNIGNNLPTITGTLSGGATTCPATPTDLFVTITGGAGPYSVAIDNGVGTISNYNSNDPISVSPLATVTYNLISVTDATGCIASTISGTATITVTPTATPTFTIGPAAVCLGSSNVDYYTEAGMTNYVWTVSAGGSVTAGGSGTEEFVTVDWTALGPQTITVKYDDTNGCTTAPVTLNITVTEISIVNAVTPNSQCSPLNGAIDITVSGLLGTGAQVTYTWDDPSLTTTEDIAGLDAGDYTVTITDALTGCSFTSATISVPDATPTLTGDITGATAICEGSSATLTFVLSGATGGTPGYDVVYTDDGGTTLIPLTNIVNGHTIVVAPTVDTDYSIISVQDVASQCFASATDINAGGIATVTVNPLPADATNPVGNSFCAGTSTTAISVDDPGVGFQVDWFANATGGSSLGAGDIFTPSSAGTYFAEISETATGCISANRVSATLTQKPQPTATLSGNATVCIGQPSTLTIALVGTGPWDVVYTDGTTNFPINAIASSPHTFSVSPVISTSYSLISVADALCSNGSVNGGAIVTVNPILGNPATFGADTWLGYVYDDQSTPAPPVSNIDFSNGKYRGFIDETDIGSLGFSSYSAPTDAFDFNLSNTAVLQGPNVCGSYLNDYSIRFRMNKTFVQGVYTFMLGGDDGVRMFIDGNPITLNPANSFTTHAYTVFTSDVQCISAGAHDLVIEYFERGGFSRVTFDYQTAPAPTVSSPVTTCVNSAIPTLTASSTDPGVTGYNWYTDAGLLNLVASTQNYTPLAADLDMTVAATTDFYVVATYACGQTQAAQVNVDVVNAATLTLPPTPTQICQSGGIVDLTTIVSALPSGGVFTFSGTGITSTPNFDPTLVSGTSTITVDYVSGGCTANTTFDIDVISTATITVPASNVTICQAGGVQDLTLLVSATPLGGAYTFSGTGVTGTNFDPSAQSGVVPITVDYLVGGCSDSKVFNFDVITTATLTVDNSTAVCPGAAPIDLTTLVTASPAGGAFTFSGATGITGNMFDPSLHANSTVVINVSYIQGGCTAISTVSIAVRAINDPLCTGGGGTGTCATVVITPVPSPATCTNSDGSIVFNIVPFVPVVNNTGVRIDIVGTSSTNNTITRTNFNDPNFLNLPTGTYDYTIEYGDPSCIKTGTVTIDQSGTVGTPVVSNIVNPICFGQPVGSLTLDVPGETGNLLEWSLDGTIWVQFSAGTQITGIPAGNLIISVRRNSSDACNAAVSVSLTDVNPDITATLTFTPATCNNNDGSLIVSGLAGGSGIANFTYELNGQAFSTLPANGIFAGLSAGSDVFAVIDNVGCRKNFPAVAITFPGFVNTTTPVASAPDCTGGGANGSIQFQINDPGTFQVGYTTDPTAPPASFAPAGGALVILTNLVNGTYYIWVQSASAQCPTKLAPVTVNGVYAVSFAATANDILCFGGSGEIDLASISGAPGLDFTYELVNSGNTTTATISASQALGTFKVTGINPGSYQIRLTQNQSSLFGACTVPLATAYQTLTITGPTAALDTLYVNKTISYPDLPTGSMLVGILESQQEPYEVRMELLSPIFPSQSFLQDWTATSRNAQTLKMELGIKNLYAGGYQLSLRDALGCVKNYPITIDVDSDIFVPNIFTPNGDGKNDLFYIRNLPADAQLIITNRWGKEVFTSNNYQNDWNGGEVADGIYYYKLALPDQSMNGWIEIMRGQ